MKKIAGVIILAAAMLASSPSSSGADSIAWGPIVDGLRLGIDFARTSSPDPILRVSLRNTGPVARDIILGYEVGKTTAYSFTFFAIAPNGKRRKDFDIVAFTPVAGLVLPVIAHLAPGTVKEFLFPLHNIVCIEKPGDLRMDKLAAEGNSLEVAFEASSDMNQMSQSAQSNLWTGKLTSGELAPPN